GAAPGALRRVERHLAGPGAREVRRRIQDGDEGAQEIRRAVQGTHAVSPAQGPAHRGISATAVRQMGTSNIEHPTPNIQCEGRLLIRCSKLVVGCWMFISN